MCTAIYGIWLALLACLSACLPDCLTACLPTYPYPISVKYLYFAHKPIMQHSHSIRWCVFRSYSFSVSTLRHTLFSFVLSRSDWLIYMSVACCFISFTIFYFIFFLFFLYFCSFGRVYFYEHSVQTTNSSHSTHARCLFSLLRLFHEFFSSFFHFFSLTNDYIPLFGIHYIDSML